MKAAILRQLGTAPVYADFVEPVPSGAVEQLITVKAAAVKNIDKLRAGGTHYASYREVPVVVGIDGVGMLDNGSFVYAQGISGMIAEKALVSVTGCVPLPEQIDPALAAALPNAVLGSAMALRNRAGMKPGDVVVVNGATGVTGQLAVQIARHYGASRVIATGRDEAALQRLKSLGADELVSLREDDASIVERLKALHGETPFDHVLDYVWGHPVELLLKALKGGGLGHFSHRVKIVTIGDMAGNSIALDSGTLRSSAIEILGSGIGSLSAQDMAEFNGIVLPELLALAADGKLQMEIHREPLERIETVWNTEHKGKRLVIMI